MIVPTCVLSMSSKSRSISYMTRICVRIWGLRMFLLYKIEFSMIRIILFMILLKWKLDMSFTILNLFFEWFFFRINFIKSFISSFYNMILILAGLSLLGWVGFVLGWLLAYFATDFSQRQSDYDCRIPNSDRHWR